MHNLDFDLIRVTTIDETISYRIMTTPGLGVNGTVKSVGTVPKDSVLLDWVHERSQ